MRRVLFIAYLFPPIANSGTRRSLCFVNHLPAIGWEPVVLTVADPPPRDCDPALLAEVRSGTRIERVPLSSDVAARRLARWLVPPGIRDRVAGGLSWRIDRLAGVPDEVASWYPTAVRRGVELHREVGFDVIYASGWPWTSFLVARAISDRTGCPYLLDYRDSWRPSGTSAWETQSRGQRVFNASLERYAAKRAAAIITVTPTLVTSVGMDASRDDVQCITNGFEPADFPPKRPGTRSAAGDVVRVAYTGVWRPGYGPDALYRAIRRLKESAVSFAPQAQGCHGRIPAGSRPRVWG